MKKNSWIGLVCVVFALSACAKDVENADKTEATALAKALNGEAGKEQAGDGQGGGEEVQQGSGSGDVVAKRTEEAPGNVPDKTANAEARKKYEKAKINAETVIFKRFVGGKTIEGDSTIAGDKLAIVPHVEKITQITAEVFYSPLKGNDAIGSCKNGQNVAKENPGQAPEAAKKIVGKDCNHLATAEGYTKELTADINAIAVKLYVVAITDAKLEDSEIQITATEVVANDEKLGSMNLSIQTDAQATATALATALDAAVDLK